MKNLTKVKIPKKYNEMIEILYKEENMYKVKASEGFYFPTIEATEGEANSHKGIWEIIRYVEEAPIEMKNESVKVDETYTIKQLWEIGKELGFKGCTRWPKVKLIEEINNAN